MIIVAVCLFLKNSNSVSPIWCLVSFNEKWWEMVETCPVFTLTETSSCIKHTTAFTQCKACMLTYTSGMCAVYLYQCTPNNQGEGDCALQQPAGFTVSWEVSAAQSDPDTSPAQSAKKKSENDCLTASVATFFSHLKMLDPTFPLQRLIHKPNEKYNLR